MCISVISANEYVRTEGLRRKNQPRVKRGNSCLEINTLPGPLKTFTIGSISNCEMMNDE